MLENNTKSRCRVFSRLRLRLTSVSSLAVLLFVALLVGCGGGGGESESASGGNVGALQANAGPDQRVAPGVTVTVDASASTGVDSGVFTYRWFLQTIPIGSTATLADANTVTPSFFADVVGTYLLQLVISDGGTTSSIDTVRVTVEDIPVVESVLATSAPDIIPEELQVICHFSPTEAGNPDCPVLSYNDNTYWAYSYRDNRNSLGIVAYDSAGAVVGQLEKTGTRNIWQISVDTDELTVTFYGDDSTGDGTVTTSWDELTNDLSINSSAPVANAGRDQFVDPGDTVTLDGTDSRGIDSPIVSYSWSLTTIPAGSTAVLANATDANPTFVADVVGAYIVQLVVNDGITDSAVASAMITASLVPVVESAMMSNPPGVIPDGMRVSCPVGADVFTSNGLCPVLRFNRYTYWAYSYSDNRSSLGIVAYDNAGEIVAQWEEPGARYVWQITVDSAALTVTFFGQGNGSVTMTWAELTP